ncbi:hypothetical protein GQ54DRAFT_102330 [Martensiomyces pterosporus]|nr:hypothetical protein GQ54DRAFT_102330 [Martensiomyces pterosporus]
MSLPTIVVAPAILAAGAVAYKYAESSGDDNHQRHGEMTSGVDTKSHAENQHPRYGARFEQDFQPEVPSERQRTDAFVPTSMLTNRNSTTSQPLSSSPSSSPWSSGMMVPSNSSGWPSSVSTRMAPSSGMSGDMHGPFPRTTDEISHSSWFHRTARTVTGDLGPIEHQPDFQSSRGGIDASQMSTTHEANSIKGSAYPAKSSIDDALSETRGWVKSNESDMQSAASKAIDSAEDTGKAVAQNASGAADEAKDWLWVKQSEVDQAVSAAKESADKAASNASEWLWGKKSEADKTIAETTGEAKSAIKNASDSARSWVSGKKSDIDQTVSDAAKEVADTSRGWFWSTKNSADRAADEIKQKADAAKDAARDAADASHGWFWSKKSDADAAVANAADTVNHKANAVKSAADNKLSDAADSMQRTARDVKASAGDMASSARDSLNAGAAGARDWAKSSMDSIDSYVSSAAQLLERGTDNARDSIDSAGRSAQSAIGDAMDSAKGAVDSAGNGVRGHRRSVSDMVSSTSGEEPPRRHSISGSVFPPMQPTATLRKDRWTDTVHLPSTDLGVDRSGGGLPEAKSKDRRDSIMSSLDTDNSVMRALDDKFNEARSILQSTTSEIKSIANDAGTMASQKIMGAAERVHLQASGEGICGGISPGKEGLADSAKNSEYRFVEVNSGIPLLSSKPE